MKKLLLTACLAVLALTASASEGLTKYVNPLLGTATLWEFEDLKFKATRRAWGAEVFPGASLPFAMVQTTPITQLHSGSGYQYEDKTIQGFGHTCKGHWNLLHVPLMPVTGRYSANNFASEYSHENETAHPGYYQVFLKRYGINAEVTGTLRCAYHKYTFKADDDKALIVDMPHSNSNVKDWSLQKEGTNTFSGSQNGEGRIFFWAVANYDIDKIVQQQSRNYGISVISFKNSKGAMPLELKIGFSFTSIENAKHNLEAEMLGKDFAQVCEEADNIWENSLER